MLCLVAACDLPSTELGSTSTTWSWLSLEDEAIDAVATTPDDEVVVALSRQLQDGSTLRKHTSEGDIAWSRSTSARMVDVAVDATGTILALGVAGDDVWWLHSHAPDGSPQWETPLPTGTQGTALGVLGDGTIVVTTNTSDQAELRGFVPTGAPAFVQPLTAAVFESLAPVIALATSPTGHVAVTGLLDEGSWVARLTPQGEMVWMSSSSAMSHHAIAIDDGGAVFTAGRPGVEMALLLRRIDAAGTVVWERTEARRAAHDVAIAEDGSLYWAGLDHVDALVVALDPDGTERWVERRSGPRAGTDEDSAIGLAFAPSHELVAAGSLDYRGEGGPEAWFRGWLGRYATGE